VCVFWSQNNKAIKCERWDVCHKATYSIGYRYRHFYVIFLRPHLLKEPKSIVADGGQDWGGHCTHWLGHNIHVIRLGIYYNGVAGAKDESLGYGEFEV
jgi:hypothetical protein